MLFAAALRFVRHPATRTLPFAACGSFYLNTSDHQSNQARCGWFGFGGGSGTTAAAKAKAEEAEALARAQRAEALRAKLGPLARLDLNGDGVIDEKDAALALERAKEAAMTRAGGDVVLRAIGEQASEVLATGVPSQVSWGFCSGYCAGFAAKKVGKIVAVAVGGVFVLLQGLAYNGYIVVDQAKIEQDFNKAFDLNKDGALDTSDLSVLYDKAYAVLSYNMPSGSGFAAGVILGLRSG